MITNEQVKQAAKKAYDVGLLTAQAPDTEDRCCMYALECRDGKVRHCAVGAVLAPLGLAPISSSNNRDPITALHTWDMFADKHFTLTVQRAHDGWCNVSREGGVTDKLEQDFLALIA